MNLACTRGACDSRLSTPNLFSRWIHVSLMISIGLSISSNLVYRQVLILEIEFHKLNQFTLCSCQIWCSYTPFKLSHVMQTKNCWVFNESIQEWNSSAMNARYIPSWVYTVELLFRSRVSQQRFLNLVEKAYEELKLSWCAFLVNGLLIIALLHACSFETPSGFCNLWT